MQVGGGAKGENLEQTCAEEPQGGLDSTALRSGPELKSGVRRLPN